MEHENHSSLIPVEPAGATPSAKDHLNAEIYGEASKANFLEGLKLLRYSGVPGDVDLIAELPEEVCEAIMTDGVQYLLGQIRDARAGADDEPRVRYGLRDRPRRGTGRKCPICV